MINEDISGGSYLTDETRIFRQSCRQFAQREYLPHREKRKTQAMVDREEGHPQ